MYRIDASAENLPTETILVSVERVPNLCWFWCGSVSYIGIHETYIQCRPLYFTLRPWLWLAMTMLETASSEWLPGIGTHAYLFWPCTSALDNRVNVIQTPQGRSFKSFRAGSLSATTNNHQFHNEFLLFAPSCFYNRVPTCLKSSLHNPCAKSRHLTLILRVMSVTVMEE